MRSAVAVPVKVWLTGSGRVPCEITPSDPVPVAATRSALRVVEASTAVGVRVSLQVTRTARASGTRRSAAARANWRCIGTFPRRAGERRAEGVAQEPRLSAPGAVRLGQDQLS